MESFYIYEKFQIKENDLLDFFFSINIYEKVSFLINSETAQVSSFLQKIDTQPLRPYEHFFP